MAMEGREPGKRRGISAVKGSDDLLTVGTECNGCAVGGLIWGVTTAPTTSAQNQRGWERCVRISWTGGKKEFCIANSGQLYHEIYDGFLA